MMVKEPDLTQGVGPVRRPSHPSRLEAPRAEGDTDHRDVDDPAAADPLFEDNDELSDLGKQDQDTGTGLDESGPSEAGSWGPLIAGASIALFVGALILLSSLGVFGS